jgi:hypothetical protein
MKIYKTVTKPATTYQEVDQIACDLCGRTTRKRWKEDGFDALETEVRIKEGSSYPEGGSGTEIEFDVCPDCFKSKLIPWLEGQGAKTTVREWEW